MASFLRKEIQAAVREELSRVISSTGTAASSNSTTSRPTTSTDYSGSSVSTSHLAEENSERTLSFDEFYARREEERQEGFRPPKKRKKKNPSDKVTMPAKIVEVEVKVGIASAADGVCKARRGKTHFVTVKSSADKEEITRKAVEKHSSFDQAFDGTIPYVLLFPDFSQVNFVPGTKEAFLLSSYKKAIGKDYKRLTFYLIPFEEFQETYDDSSTEECAKEENFAGGSTRRQESAALHRKETIVLNDDDESLHHAGSTNSDGKYLSV